ncbi:MAG: hypothetical protein ACRD4X_18675 [Candidatus Acidiferrales bacterium]
MKNGVKTASRLKGGVSPDVGKATQFKPGNPGGGRPRTAKFAEAFRQLAAEVNAKGKTGAQAFAEYCWKRAMKGSARHAEMVKHYAEGRPATRSEEETFPTDSPLEAAPTADTDKIKSLRDRLARGEVFEIPPTKKPN